MDTEVFKNQNQYVHCLSVIKVIDAGEVVYRGARDPVWKKTIRRSFIHTYMYDICTECMTYAWNVCVSYMRACVCMEYMYVPHVYMCTTCA